MFSDPEKLPAFSFEAAATSSTDTEARHLVNRLRLEFRTASQRQLVDAVEAAFKSANTYAGEKILQLARASLESVLTPAIDRTDDPTSLDSEPPFREKTG